MLYDGNTSVIEVATTQDSGASWSAVTRFGDPQSEVYEVEVAAASAGTPAVVMWRDYNSDKLAATTASDEPVPVAPTITTVAPARGSTRGGTTVTITGTNFVAGATVKFGTTAATSVVRVNDTTITAKTPAHAAGAVSVTVTNPDAQSGTKASACTYTSTPPVAKSITITKGGRTHVSKRRDLLVATGVATGIKVGASLTTMIKRGTDSKFIRTKAKLKVGKDGEFTYKRKLRPGTTLTVYVTWMDITSNKVTWKPLKKK